MANQAVRGDVPLRPALDEADSTRSKDSGEVGTVDVLLVFWRHRRSMAAVFSIVVMASLAAALLLPKKYEYRATLELYMLSGHADEGELRQVADLLKLRTEILREILPRVIAEVSNNSAKPKAYPFKVEAQRGENTVSLVIISTAEDETTILQIMSRVFDEVKADMAEAGRIEKIKLELSRDRLMDEMLNMKDYLSDIQRQAERIENRIESGRQRSVLLESLLADANKRREKLQSEKASDMAVMRSFMLDSEIRNLSSQLDAVEVQKMNLSGRLDSIQSEIAMVQRNLDKQSMAIDLGGLELSGFQPARLLVTPARSAAPVGPPRLLLMLVGLIVASLLAILLAFFLEFVSLARRRISKAT